MNAFKVTKVADSYLGKQIQKKEKASLFFVPFDVLYTKKNSNNFGPDGFHPTEEANA